MPKAFSSRYKGKKEAIGILNKHPTNSKYNNSLALFSQSAFGE